MVIRGNSNQPILDLYPIVVDLDNEALDNSFAYDTSRTSIYDAVSSLASERSWMIEDQADTETPSTSTEALPTPAGSPSQRSRHSRCQSFQDPSLDENLQNPPAIRRYRSFGPIRRHDREQDNKKAKHRRNHSEASSSSGSAFSNFLSMLQFGSHRISKHKKARSLDSAETMIEKNPVIENNPFPNISPVPSPIRVGPKRNRPRWFHDEYVLTQQIVRCRTSTLWECVHRPTGRRYCTKEIDKRRFSSPSQRAMVVREIHMHRRILQSSPPSCLPTIRDIFADEEAAESRHSFQEECKASTDSCSEDTKSTGSNLGFDEPTCNNYWYIVQDFEAGGGNLSFYLNELQAQKEVSQKIPKTMKESEVRLFARSLLIALNELHHRSICHNDLCPENILIPPSTINHHCSDKEKVPHHKYHRRTQSNPEISNDPWEALKLCDLGRAFMVDDFNANTITHRHTPGSKPPVHSSIYYTSPEVILGNSPGLASDMWSVGVLLYRCIAGELPFRGQSEDSIYSEYSSNSVTSSTATNDWRLRQQLKREIIKADCKFGRSCRMNTDPRWARVSRAARQFLSALLNPSPTVRMTCEEALYHPWLMNGILILPSSPSNNSIPPSASHLTLPMMPLLPSLTKTNHYHHHPHFSTIKMHVRENANRVDAKEPGETEEKRSLSSSPRSFVDKMFGRRKNSISSNSSPNRSHTNVHIETK